jgi:large subunit ribosomal protein L1
VKAAKVRSKKYIEMKKLVPVVISHSISEGINLIRKTSLASFGGSVEMHITLADRNWSKGIELPHKLPGKAKRIVEVTDEIIASIESGKFDFDILVATPAQMGKLVKYAKVLGPKGLMPNPKNGTVTENVDLAIKRLSSDTTVKLKTDKDGPAVHLVVGKMTMTDEQLSQNISAVMAILPAGRIKKVILKSTMSPAVKLN